MRSIWMTAAFLVPLATISEVAADQPTRPADPKGSSGSAAVSDAEMSTADRFAAIDTDGDGQIVQEEARAALERLFARMDEDQSGYLSADEFSGFHLPTRANPDQFKRQHDFDLHIALEVDRATLEATIARGEAEGIETRGISDHGFIDSVYFRDPDGYVVEFTTRTAEEHALLDRGRARRTLDEWQAAKARQLGAPA